MTKEREDKVREQADKIRTAATAGIEKWKKKKRACSANIDLMAAYGRMLTLIEKNAKEEMERFKNNYKFRGTYKEIMDVALGYTKDNGIHGTYFTFSPLKLLNTVAEERKSFDEQVMHHEHVKIDDIRNEMQGLADQVDRLAAFDPVLYVETHPDDESYEFYEPGSAAIVRCIDQLVGEGLHARRRDACPDIHCGHPACIQ